MKKDILLTAITFLSLASCQSEDNFELNQSEIQLTSVVNPMSRGTSLTQQATQIVNGQEVGVTIIDEKESHTNTKWTAGEDGTLTNTGKAVYWANTEATIYAYHPYNSSWTGTDKLESFSVNTDQTTDAGYLNSDLLWTTKTETKTTNPVELSFVHKLAKINVTLTSEDIVDLSGATISICRTKISTNFNPLTGDLSSASSEAIIKAGVTTTEAYTASAIVIPQTVAAETQLIKINHGDKIFYHKLSADKEFKSGYSYNFILNVKEKLEEVELKSDNITDWEIDEDGNTEGDAEEVVETLLLPNGSSFNSIVGDFLEENTNLTKIKFVANSNTTSESILVTDEDGTKGYLVANGEWLEIHTSANEFMAHKDCSSMFRNNWVKMSGGEEITDTSVYMGNITEIDFSNFNTLNVTDMSSMFYGCKNLTSLDVSNFNTSNVTNMVFMFGHCYQLSFLSVNNFKTSKVVNMMRMFNRCENLSSLDVSNFDTSNVTNMEGMFFACGNLISLRLENFKTTNVTDMSYMFSDCTNLTSLDLSSFSFDKIPTITNSLRAIGANANEHPIAVKIKEEGYTYLTEKTTDCGIDSNYAKFVKTDGTDW